MGRRAKLDIAKDINGTYTRCLGWKGEPDNYRQHKFYLGKDKAQAQIRSLRLELVWAEVERFWQKERLPGRPVWEGLELQIAQAVSRGEEVCRLNVTDHVDLDCATPEDIEHWLQVEVRARFPLIRIVIGEDDIRTVGEAGLDREREEAERALAEAAAVVARLARKTPGGGQRLHAALDAWEADLNAGKYAPSAANRNRMTKDVALIKAHIGNTTLNDVNLKFLDAWVQYWANRPIGKRGKPVAPKTAGNMVKRVRAFIKWLHRAADWNWRKPEDYEVGKVDIALTTHELSRMAGDAPTYSDEELCLLWKHAKPVERLWMCLALNCGFGIAELGSLQINELHIDKPHRKYKTPGSWIYRLRKKSRVYGDWKLWDTTVEGVRWYLSVRPASDETCLLLNGAGRPLVKDTDTGNRGQNVPNAWDALVKRVRKLSDAAFRKLSFNKLRKTAASAVRELASGETAGIFLSHGKPVASDGILDLYAGKDFKKVHKACDEWGGRLAPVLSSVENPFAAAKRKHRTAGDVLALRARVVELRGEGKTLDQIGEIVGKSRNAVAHHLKQARK
ncbi:MAG: hypothetical protein K2W96_17125 [Gemmataceae bacterium]|nr:hypothetical protein [Gemmataceae bacterium]